MGNLLAYDFMQRAFLAGAMVGVIAPTIGMFLVMRRYSFLADALSHVSLAGIAFGALVGAPVLLTSVITSAVTGLAIEELRMRKKVLGESSLVLFLSGGLAASAVLISLNRGSALGLTGILFGSITTVTWNDLFAIAALGVVVLLFVFTMFGRLFAVAFDEELAITIGLPVKTLNRVFMLLAAVTVSTTLSVTGALLVSALMVVPVVTAMQFGKSFRKTYVIAVAASLLSVFIGLAASYYAEIASGGAIVLVAIFLFLLSLAWNMGKGR